MTTRIYGSSLLLALALSLCACATAKPPKTAEAPLPLTPTEQYAISVRQAPQQLALAIHLQGLSANQQNALSDFFSRWHDNGGGAVTVRTPLNGGGDPALARRTADAAVSYLKRLGVPADRLKLAGYDARRVPAAPVIAAFERFEAVGPDCSTGWDNLTSTKKNRPSSHFGCAATANIAAMIANPRDLVTPAAVDPADDSRREVVLGKYRQGAVTSTAVDEQASGKVSGN